MPVRLTFQSPSYDAANIERDGAEEVTESFYELSLDVVGFDLDHSALTVYVDEDSGNNYAFAEPAPFTNEEGTECGDIGWRIEPDAFLLRVNPSLRQHVGGVYGRVIVTHGDMEVDRSDALQVRARPNYMIDTAARRGRYYADTFDADGKHYVFDEVRQGDQCAGPFDTIEAAQAEAERLNSPPSYIPRVECQDSDSMVVLLDGLAGFHVDLAYVEGQGSYCSNPVQIMHTDQDGDLVVCEVVNGNPVTNATWAIPLAALKTISVL